MAAHNQEAVNVIFARYSINTAAVEPARQPPSSVPRVQILGMIQPSLTRLHSTTHLERLLRLQHNEQSSQTGSNAHLVFDTEHDKGRSFAKEMIGADSAKSIDLTMDDGIGSINTHPDTCLDHSTNLEQPLRREKRENLLPGSYFDLHSSRTSQEKFDVHGKASLSEPNKPEDKEAKSINSKDNLISIRDRPSPPTEDSGRLDDSSFGTTLAHQTTHRDNDAINHTAEASSFFSHEQKIWDSPKIMSPYEENQTLQGLKATMDNKSSCLNDEDHRGIWGSRKQKDQRYSFNTPSQTQDLAINVNTTRGDNSVVTDGQSKFTKLINASTKPKIWTPQEQVQQKEQDAKAEREMQDMDREYHKQTEIRRKTLAKMERNAELKRSIASAADARRVVERREAVECEINDDAKQRAGRHSAQLPTLCDEINDNGKKVKAKDTKPIHPAERSTSQSRNATPPRGVTCDAITETLPNQNRRFGEPYPSHQSNANQKILSATRQVCKSMDERERRRKASRLKVTATAQQNCLVPSPTSNISRRISSDEHCFNSISVTKTVQMTADTNTAKAILNTAGKDSSIDDSLLLTAASGSTISQALNTLPAQTPQESSLTICDVSNATSIVSQESPMIMDIHLVQNETLDEENKLSTSMSTELLSTVRDIAPVIAVSPACPIPPQNRHDIHDTISSLSPDVLETALHKYVESGPTRNTFDNKSDLQVEDLVLRYSTTKHTKVGLETTPRVGEHTEISNTLPTVLEVHETGPAVDFDLEDSNSLFGDINTNNTDISEGCRMHSPDEANASCRTAIQEAQQECTIIGQWAIVDPEDKKHDANQISIEESENLLKMQMLEMESKKSRTGIISAIHMKGQDAPNKRRKLDFSSLAPSKSQDDSVGEDISYVTDERRRANRRPTISEQDEANRQSAVKYRQNKTRKNLRQRQQRTPESIKSKPSSLLRPSSGSSKLAQKCQPQFRGFAALDGVSAKNPEIRKGILQKPSSATEDFPPRVSRRLSKQNMHLSYEERIALVKAKLAKYSSQNISGMDVQNSDQHDIEVQPVDLEAFSNTYGNVSASSSDEDEDEEHAKQRQMQQHDRLDFTRGRPRKTVPETFASEKSVFTGKRIPRKTTEPQVYIPANTTEDEMADVGSEECPNITKSDGETANEDILWHYFVNCKMKRTDEDSEEDALEDPCGTFLTKEEANKVANTKLQSFIKDSSLGMSVGWTVDALGLQTCFYRDDSIDVELAVSRDLVRKAKLPKSAGRIPKVVYGVYHCVIQRFHGKRIPDKYTFIHVASCSVLDMANREAGKAWLAHELRELVDSSYMREVEGPDLQNKMRKRLDALEEEGGFFIQQGRHAKEDHEMEVEVWVDEKEVQGPRN